MGPSGAADDLTQVRQQAAQRWQQRAAAAADPCVSVQSSEGWLPHAQTPAAAEQEEEEEFEEEKTPSERTVLRIQIQTEITSLERLLAEDLRPMEPNMSIAFTINRVEAQIAELRSQIQGLDATEDDEELSEGSADEILWEEALDATRKGNEMWLQTYTGGPSGG